MKNRILIVNKFYYPRGGDCVCTLNLEKLLSDNGHETAIYAMSFPDNIATPWDKYFASEVSFSGSISGLAKAVMRTMGIGDITDSFKHILSDYKPDVVHLNNIHSYLSPILAVLAKKAGARVVWTLHDYKLICPSYSCTLNGEPCEKCFTNKLNVLSNRCMKGSLPASAIAWIEAIKWNRVKLEKVTDLFICPSRFMYSKMKQAGFSPDKLTVLCNFVDPVKLNKLSVLPTDHKVTDMYCYIGRLSQEKGIAQLLEVAATLPQFQLMVAGDGPLSEYLRSRYARNDNIHFLGRLDAQGVSDLLTRSYISIIPSMCYENNPLGVIESLCAGTPVIGAQIGGIPELIDQETGITYAWNDNDLMRSAILAAFAHRWDNATIKSKSIARFSPQAHYQELLKIYS